MAATADDGEAMLKTFIEVEGRRLRVTSEPDRGGRRIYHARGRREHYVMRARRVRGVLTWVLSEVRPDSKPKVRATWTWTREQGWHWCRVLPSARQALAALEAMCEGRKRAPALKQLAVFAREFIPGVHVEIEDGYCSTDRKVGRLRIPGLGRKGNRLVVREGARWGQVLLDHNAADPCRHNGDVLVWLARRLGHPRPFSFLTRWL